MAAQSHSIEEAWQPDLWLVPLLRNGRKFLNAPFDFVSSLLFSLLIGYIMQAG